MNSAFKVLYDIGMTLQRFGSTVYNFLTWELDFSSIGFGSVAVSEVLFGTLFWTVITVSALTYLKRMFI